LTALLVPMLPDHNLVASPPMMENKHDENSNPSAHPDDAQQRA
jgi:hypothetical protein